MWLIGVLGVAAGLVQASGVSWWGPHPLVMWPALLVAATLPASPRAWLVAALAGGLAWDSVSGTAGPATLSLLAAGAAARMAEKQWLPARGSTSVAALAAGMVLAVRLLLLVAAGFRSPAVPMYWWVVEAACTGAAAALVNRLAAPLYGRRSI